MKSIFSVIIIVSLIIISSAELYSQYITNWDFIDSTDLYYNFGNGGGMMSGKNKNDFVIWGMEDKVLPNLFHYSCFEMRLYNNEGNNHKVIF